MNGPFTPDLYHPISQLKATATEKGWPLDVRVGKTYNCTRKVSLVLQFAHSLCSQQVL